MIIQLSNTHPPRPTTYEQLKRKYKSIKIVGKRSTCRLSCIQFLIGLHRFVIRFQNVLLLGVTIMNLLFVQSLVSFKDRLTTLRHQLRVVTTLNRGSLLVNYSRSLQSLLRPIYRVTVLALIHLYTQQKLFTLNHQPVQSLISLETSLQVRLLLNSIGIFTLNHLSMQSLISYQTSLWVHQFLHLIGVPVLQLTTGNPKSLQRLV